MSDISLPSDRGSAPPQAAPGERASEGIFLRQSSGLVREFRPRDVFVFNTLGYALGLVLASVPTFVAGLWPAQNVLVIVTIGTACTLVNAFMYGLMSGIFPRAGGDYAFLSRTVSPGFGFVANWGFTWSQFLGIGLYATYAVNFGISIAFATVGNALHSQTLLDWSVTTTHHWPTFLIATGILILVLIVLLLPSRVMRTMFAVTFLLALLGTFITIGVMFATSHADFVSNFNAYMADQGGHATYASIIAKAHAGGFSAGSATIGGALLAIPIGYWIYIGFTYSSYIGGEVREPSRTQPRMILATLLFAYVVYMVAFWRYYDVVGSDLTNAVVYLNGTSAGSGLTVSPVLNFFTGLMTGSPVLNVLMGISFILWNTVLLFVMAMICTRNLFAWSFDRIVPDKVAAVSDRARAPWVATIVVVVLAEALMAIFVFTTFFSQVNNYIVIFSVAFWLASWGAILLPYRRPEIFAGAPQAAQRRIAGVPVLTLLGVGNLLLFSLILYASFKEPAFSGPTGGRAIIFVVAIYVVGAIIYAGAKLIQRRRGVDLNLLYREISPE